MEYKNGTDIDSLHLHSLSVECHLVPLSHSEQDTPLVHDVQFKGQAKM